ncbi:MAG TPA: hypothetical protein VGG89_04950 [Candidatus Baltobacteraceae bacterium]
MTIARTVFAACASATIALLTPAVAGAVPTSYLPGAPPCTTKEAQRPITSLQPSYASSIQPPVRSEMTMLPPRGHTVNDFPILNTIPTVYAKPSDEAVTKNSTSQPSTFANGQKALPISTCGSTI